MVRVLLWSELYGQNPMIRAVLGQRAMVRVLRSKFNVQNSMVRVLRSKFNVQNSMVRVLGSEFYGQSVMVMVPLLLG